ncbi:MAG TPA: alpha-amylase family glycosyl hydrolase [Candidatus Limnocylindrales bacterium]|nr:alpha-amylase family glycosyl hydrolase [Candidatus Limnocylindrales bacterium]
MTVGQRSGRQAAADPFRYGPDWWQRGVFYQIYPRSFADTDGDGTGDLRGIVDHLDYLGRDGLDVDAVWLSPIYPSPGIDVGYDVSDHTAVDPLFGSEADFDRLVREAHRRGIRIVMDLVMNHTSDQHPWFIASRASREGPYADWYLWRDPAGTDRRGRPLPPNDWVSWFGGPGWTYEPGRGQFYHHTFLAEQPELDWRNPAVVAAQFAMVRGWLARGVDGFRLDTFNVFLKHPDALANPRRRGRDAWTRQLHQYDFDQPDLPELIERFRAVVDATPGHMTVGELFVGTTEGAAALTAGHHLVFDWELLDQPWSAPAFAAAIRRRERAFGPDRWPTIVLSNHDQPRHVSKLADSVGATGPQRDAIARAAAVLELTMRGTPFLYYGEELGMGVVEVPPDESIDEAARHVGPGFSWWDRSASRTPMPWRPGPGGGFTTGRPWLRLGPDVDQRNVAVQRADPDSVLACYQRLIAARNGLASLQDGSLTMVRTGDPDVLGYRRRGSGSDVLVLIGFADHDHHPRIPRPHGGSGGWRPVVGSHRDLPDRLTPGSPTTLRPHEAIVAVAI